MTQDLKVREKVGAKRVVARGYHDWRVVVNSTSQQGTLHSRICLFFFFNTLEFWYSFLGENVFIYTSSHIYTSGCLPIFEDQFKTFFKTF